MTPIRRMTALAGLEPTEYVQDADKVQQIAAALGTDPDNIMWDDLPALAIDATGTILDGHHRVAAARQCGLVEYPAIVVDRTEWDASANNHYGRLTWACDMAGDAVTYGSAN